MAETCLDGEILDVDWAGWSGKGTSSSVIHLKCFTCYYENDPSNYDLEDGRPKTVVCQKCGAAFEALKSVDVSYTTRPVSRREV